MFKSYFIIAIRNFWKNKIFSIINIAGLAIGISAALVIYLIVQYEFSFDKFEKDRDRIYRIVSVMHFPDQAFRLSGVPAPLVTAAGRSISGISTVAPLILYSAGKVEIPSASVQGNAIYKKQSSVIFADENYFKLLSYKWLEGSASQLNKPFCVVLTESRANTYFGSSNNAIGKTIIYNDSVRITVAGVVKDINERTDFTFKEFISYATVGATNLKNHYGFDNWGSVNSSFQLLIQLSPRADPGNVEKQIADIREKNAKDAYLKTDHLLQPLSDIHFNADYDAFGEHQAHKPTLYGLLLVAVFLLLLGCINFINLTTAQSVQRAREIGIRKTMGGSKLQLAFQFLNETFVLTLIATCLSIALAPLLLQIFRDFIPPGLRFDLKGQPGLILFLVLLVVIVTIAAGFYPSILLSRYNPVSVLKNQVSAGTAKTRKAWLRKTLTVSQFVIAQFFIIVTLAVGMQIRFTLNKDLGFRKDAVLTVNTPSAEMFNAGKKQLLLEKLKAIPGIQAVALGGSAPATQSTSFSTVRFFRDKKEIESTMEVKSADSSYFRLYGMKLIAGRFPLPSDNFQKECVVNENYVKLLGYRNPSDVLGQTIEWSGKKIPVVGVLADFHFKSLHTAIQPLAYTAVAVNYGTFHVALAQGSAGKKTWAATILDMEKVYKEVYPDAAFDYKFLDENIASFYKTEKDTAALLRWATGLCIFISCLGLLGLVIYTTHLRTKEIGIRKVLGASVLHIVAILSAEFMTLVLLAFVIASPFAWWITHEWLNDFAYRIGIDWKIFAVGGGFMIMAALLTLSLRVIRSATTNPVKNLRTE